MDGQAGDFTNEVVITPEMIEAGASTLALFDADDRLEQVALTVFLAMRRHDPSAFQAPGSS